MLLPFEGDARMTKSWDQDIVSATVRSLLYDYRLQGGLSEYFFSEDRRRCFTRVARDRLDGELQKSYVRIVYGNTLTGDPFGPEREGWIKVERPTHRMILVADPLPHGSPVLMDQVLEVRIGMPVHTCWNHPVITTVRPDYVAPVSTVQTWLWSEQERKTLTLTDKRLPLEEEQDARSDS